MNKDILGLFREILKFDSSGNNIVGIGHGHKYIRGKNTGQEALTILVKKKFSTSDLRSSSVLPRTMNDMSTDIIEVGDI
ncbi:MAG: hypothetical protein K0R55_3841, partial [Sporomusa sp.]|nr:hypothetical protein [Sporomusa sp.]